MIVARILVSAPLLLAAGAASQTVVLADGRAEGAADGAALWAGREAVLEATAAARAYWIGRDDAYEEELRVLDVAEGSFTSRAAPQHAVLYLMSLWPRCCPKMGVAIVERDRLVANVAFEGTEQTLHAVPDLDGDGLNELVFTGEFGMGGSVSRSMTLASFGPDGLADLGGESIMESDCAAGAGGGMSSAARVTARPGPRLELSVERYRQPCDGGAWAATGPSQTLTLAPVSDHRYVALPLSIGGTAGIAGLREAGRLEAGDATLTSGEFYDEYVVPGRRGQTISVDLRSNDFDPYLIVAPPGVGQIDNDDYEGDLTRSFVQTTLTQDGDVRVRVTSYRPGETGAYELAIDE